jgi:hypothetical protein
MTVCLSCARVTQDQWRAFGDAVDHNFEALPPEQGIGLQNVWGSIVASIHAATHELRPSVPLPPVFRPSAEEKRELRDLRAVQRKLRTMPSLGRARDAYCVAHERLRVLKRSQQSRADMRGHLRGLRANEDTQRDRRVHQRLFAAGPKRDVPTLDVCSLKIAVRVTLSRFTASLWIAVQERPL